MRFGYMMLLYAAAGIKNQTRLLSGEETGLAAYWRFDETIQDQFYDLSFHGENYNRNDGTMNASAVALNQRSHSRPAFVQSLY